MLWEDETGKNLLSDGWRERGIADFLYDAYTYTLIRDLSKCSYNRVYLKITVLYFCGDHDVPKDLFVQLFRFSFLGMVGTYIYNF